jgi:uncharacterized DUF497 family protein
MTDRKIVWDLEKAAENWKKHRVTFDSAALIFLDPLRIERRDDSEGNTTGEERRQTLGRSAAFICRLYGARRRNALNFSTPGKQGGEKELLWQR